jgi:hypothetical protein
MATQITATVVGGMLRPDERLPLPDQSRVNLTIEPISEGRDPAAACAELKARLNQRPIQGGRRYTRDELHVASSSRAT